MDVPKLVFFKISICFVHFIHAINSWFIWFREEVRMYSEGGPGPPLFLATNILLEFTYRNLNYDRVHPHFFGRCMLKTV